MRQYFQRMRAFVLRRVPGACGFRSEGEQRGVARYLVELSKVIEQNLRALGARELGAHGRVFSVVAQQTIGEATIGNRARLFLDRLQRRPDRGIGIQVQTQRKERREPADAARQVEARADVLAAVAFHFDQEGCAASGLPERRRESGQQSVVDLGSVRSRNVLQEGCCLRGIKFDGQRGDFGFEARVMRDDGQRSGGRVQHAEPNWCGRRDVWIARISGEASRVGLE